MVNNDGCEFFRYWEESCFKNISETEVLILSGIKKKIKKEGNIYCCLSCVLVVSAFSSQWPKAFLQVLLPWKLVFAFLHCQGGCLPRHSCILESRGGSSVVVEVRHGFEGERCWEKTPALPFTWCHHHCSTTGWIKCWAPAAFFPHGYHSPGLAELKTCACWVGPAGRPRAWLSPAQRSCWGKGTECLEGQKEGLRTQHTNPLYPSFIILPAEGIACFLSCLLFQAYS